MVKHHKTAGVSFETVKIDGKEYKIRPIPLAIYAEMESYIISLREDPLKIASDSMETVPEKCWELLWNAALKQVVTRNIVTASEASDFENSVQGIAWKFWKCVQQDHPEIESVEAALKLMSIAGDSRLPEIVKKVELGSGADDLGK